MYKREMTLLKKYVKDTGPQGLLDVFTTVLATIRTPFYKVVHLSEDIKDLGLESKALWGNKKEAYKIIVDNKDEFYEVLVNSITSERTALDFVLKTKGLGLAKASFGLQMLGYDLACLDTHNLKRLGYSDSYFSRKEKAEEYIRVVQEKGAEYWWNSWCKLIPETRGKNLEFRDADEVSYTHVIAVRGY